MKTTENPLRIGYIGVGLMGHGAAKNIVTKGYPLTVFDPYAKDSVRDLVQRGATEAASVVDLASKSDVVFLSCRLRRRLNRLSMAPTASWARHAQG